jgi:hypothetical protein
LELVVQSLILQRTWIAGCLTWLRLLSGTCLDIEHFAARLVVAATEKRGQQ